MKILISLFILVLIFTGCKERIIEYTPIAEYEYTCPGIGTYRIYTMRDKDYTGGMTFVHSVEVKTRREISLPDNCVSIKIRDIK